MKPVSKPLSVKVASAFSKLLAHARDARKGEQGAGREGKEKEETNVSVSEGRDNGGCVGVKS